MNAKQTMKPLDRFLSALTREKAQAAGGPVHISTPVTNCIQI